ncbi:hypothetical protein H920_08942 [Fukomys damarensis]|uniref:Uncharacterized protein n=1 Tax=Fukomys damarensis TaxID=885580 RepID=A0A091DGN6_FUKDA|nr:hypothetical protein H920_08942 [Fukomys damarensis]
MHSTNRWSRDDLQIGHHSWHVESGPTVKVKIMTETRQGPRMCCTMQPAVEDAMLRLHFSGINITPTRWRWKAEALVYTLDTKLGKSSSDLSANQDDFPWAQKPDVPPGSW